MQVFDEKLILSPRIFFSLSLCLVFMVLIGTTNGVECRIVQMVRHVSRYNNGAVFAAIIRSCLYGAACLEPVAPCSAASIEVLAVPTSSSKPSGGFEAVAPKAAPQTLNAIKAGGQVEKYPAKPVAQKHTPPSPAVSPSAAIPNYETPTPHVDRKPTSSIPIADDPAKRMTGRYAIARGSNKIDTGCMLLLNAAAPGPDSSYFVRLAPACRDQGLLTFNPTGWESDGQSMIVHSGKGNYAHFTLQSDGQWAKDDADGKPLFLKRL
jgi:hypothetical protein